MKVTKETRRESYIKTDKISLRNMVKDIIRDAKKPITAREIAVVLWERKVIHSPERSIIQPRITELAQDNEIVASGKVFDQSTQRKVACYIPVVSIDG